MEEEEIFSVADLDQVGSDIFNPDPRHWKYHLGLAGPSLLDAVVVKHVLASIALRLLGLVNNILLRLNRHVSI